MGGGAAPRRLALRRPCRRRGDAAVRVRRLSRGVRRGLRADEADRRADDRPGCAARNRLRRALRAQRRQRFEVGQSRRRRGAAPLDPGPERLEATAQANAIVRAIREGGVAARISTNAGDYVCNHLYYGALQYLRGVSPLTPAVFLHLPATPEQTPPRASRRRLPTTDAERALKAAVGIMNGDRGCATRPAGEGACTFGDRAGLSKV